MMEERKAMSDDQLYRQYLSGDAAADDDLMLSYTDVLTAYHPLAAYIYLTGT